MFSTPAVAGDLVFAGSCNGFYRAIEKDSGAVRWEYETKSDGAEVEFHGDPLITEELVVTGSDRRQPDGVGHVYAFERQTGKVRWKHSVPHGVTTDVRRLHSNVYAVTLDDEVLCLNLKTGRPVWTFPTGFPNPDFLFDSTPAVEEKRVYFGGLDGTLYALDADSGATIWKRDLGARISTSVVIAGESLLTGTAGGRAFRVEKDTGKILAELTLQEAPAGRLLLAQECLLMFLGEHRLACVDPSLGRVRWSQPFPTLSSARPYAWKGAALAGGDRGDLAAFRLSDGSPVWSGKLEGTLRGIGSFEDVLYVGTLKGSVHAWMPPLPAR